MSTTRNKIPLKKATNIANRFLALINPHITKAEIAGAIRRQNKEVSEIIIVCVEDTKNPLEGLFTKDYPGLVTNGKRMKKFVYPKDDVQIELYVIQKNDYGRMLAIRTGSSAFSHLNYSTIWNRIGWASTEDGLRRKKECVKKGGKWKVRPEYEGNVTKPPYFTTEYDFYNFLGINWTPPDRRNWIALRDEHNY
jgi:DNA polymerase/3'-5' exonuclease PolX